MSDKLPSPQNQQLNEQSVWIAEQLLHRLSRQEAIWVAGLFDRRDVESAVMRTVPTAGES